jgi:lipopolysaccharide transport system ATP-binding protein
MRPDLFIVDEALGGGDLQFRQKFQKYIREYIDNGGSILLCSHEMYQIQTLCRRCILLDRGVKVTEGETVDVIHAYHELMMETERLASTKNVAMSAPANDHGDVEALSANEAQAESATSIAAVIPDTMVLENVCVRSQDGGSLRPGTAVEIEVSCLSPEDLTGVSCAIEIGRGDIFPITTLIGGSIDAPLNLQAGRSFLRCSIDRFTLAPGQFDLRAVISDIRSGAVLAQRGYDDAPFQFEVFTPADPLSNMMKYRQNLIFLPTIWQ